MRTKYQVLEYIVSSNGETAMKIVYSNLSEHRAQAMVDRLNDKEGKKVYDTYYLSQQVIRSYTKVVQP